MSLRDKLLKRATAKVVVYPHPFFGETVYMKVMSGAEKDSYDTARRAVVEENGETKIVPDWTNTRAKLLARVLCDEAGRRIFADTDADQLGTLDGNELDRAFEFAAELNCLTKESRDTLRKNSEPTGENGSGTGSPLPSEKARPNASETSTA